MSTYVIGDVQGCANALERLLDRIGPTEGDAIWFCGDLVNRGPDNVSVLRRARELDATVVLGNHDLHLLAQARGLRRLRATDTLGDVLRAPDRDELLGWLQSRPFVVRDGDRVMVHAGFLPSWTWAEVERRAARAARALRESPDALFAQMSRRPGRRPALGNRDIRAVAKDLGVLTRVRMLDANGRPDAFAGPPEDAPSGLEPWYAQSALEPELTVYFGHWAALGYRRIGRFVGLDSGCVWGAALTAVRAEDGAVFRVDAEPAVAGERAT